MTDNKYPLADLEKAYKRTNQRFKQRAAAGELDPAMQEHGRQMLKELLAQLIVARRAFRRAQRLQ
jgi:hypothetical protein